LLRGAVTSGKAQSLYHFFVAAAFNNVHGAQRELRRAHLFPAPAVSPLP
jgi:hypothetical protein